MQHGHIVGNPGPAQAKHAQPHPGRGERGLQLHAAFALVDGEVQQVGPAPERTAAPATTALTATPARNTWTRRALEISRGATTAAGHTLIHVATESRTAATAGRSAAWSRAMITIGAVMPSTRAKLR